MAHALDDLFATAAAQNAADVPSDALMARVLADAARAQQRPEITPVFTPARVGLWPGLAALFGGGGVLASVAMAAVAGLYLGFAQPPVMLQVTDAVIGNSGLESVDLMPGVDALFSEDQ